MFRSFPFDVYDVLTRSELDLAVGHGSESLILTEFIGLYLLTLHNMCCPFAYYLQAFDMNITSRPVKTLKRQQPSTATKYLENN